MEHVNLTVGLPTTSPAYKLLVGLINDAWYELEHGNKQLLTNIMEDTGLTEEQVYELVEELCTVNGGEEFE